MGNAARAIVGVVLIVLSFYTGGAGYAAAARILFAVGSSLALGALSMALASKPTTRRTGQDIEYSGTVEPRRIVYGTQKISGMNVIPPWTSGKKNGMLHQVLALGGHQFSDITDVYFGQDLIHDADIGNVNNTLASGKVSTGTYANKAWVRRYLGTGGQTVDYILNRAFPTEWDITHVGSKVPYIALQFEVDEEIYRTGKPEISVIAKGAKCYSLRLDPVPGSDVNNSTYTVFTSNPVDCLIDYLLSTIYGLGEDASKIDWDLAVIAANVCDELVSIPPISPVTTQKRYTCNVTLDVALTDEDLRNNITVLVGSMMGNVIYRNGKWRIYAGSANDSTFDLTADDLVQGQLSMRTEVPSNEKYNYVRGQFVDRDRFYQLSEFEPRANAAYEVEDLNKRLPREVVYPACDNQYEAQRNAIITLKRSRRRQQLTGKFGMTAYKVRTWDVGECTFDELGWNNRLVRCIAWSFTPEGQLEVTLLEEEPADWDDPLVTEYAIPTTGTGAGRPDYIPPDPINFVAQSALDGIRFGFTYPDGTIAGTRAFIWEATLGAAFSTAVKVSPNFLGNSYFLAKADTTIRDYWITLQNLAAHPPVESNPVGPASAGALSISSGFHGQQSSNTVYKQLSNVTSGNTGNVTVTPVNGASPYTYLWTLISGAATITPNSPTAASTSFHNTGMVDQESNTAKYRCRITDNGAAIADVFVQVTFFRDDGL